MEQLILMSCWGIGGARYLQRLGFKALTTTSFCVA